MKEKIHFVGQCVNTGYLRLQICLSFGILRLIKTLLNNISTDINHPTANDNEHNFDVVFKVKYLMYMEKSS